MEGKDLLHISVLGSLTVVRQSTRLQLPPSKKTRALLAYLAVTARRHSRDRLCAMFWNVPDDPRAALRWSLTRLRPLIDERDHRRIIADRENVRLDLTRANVDFLSLRNATRQGINFISTDALREAVEALDGEFLEGLDLPDCQEFQSWCTAEREESRRLRVRLLTALIARLEQAPAEALPYVRTLSLLEPANEAAKALLVRVRAVGCAIEAEEQSPTGMQQLAEHRVVRIGVLQQPVQLVPQGDVCKSSYRAFEERLHARATLHEVRFCKTSDDVRIAYASVGDGPPIIWAAHWLSHLSFSWESPVWRHWTQEFAKDHRFVHYDERGNGLSDFE
jgi:DNA-binding SARP family transcriptional activator